MRFSGNAFGALGCLLAVTVAIAGCGEAAVGSGPRSTSTSSSSSPSVTKASPSASVPKASTSAPLAKASTSASVPKTNTAKTDPPPTGAHTIEVADPEEAKSFPAPASVHHSAAATPTKSGEVAVAAGAPSDAEVQHELKQMQAAEQAARHSQQQTAVTGGESIGGNGTIPIPSDVPEVVQRVIAGANAIADFPYVFGGGHGSFVDNAYDCSGSVSYALAAGGLLSAPEVSGDLETWGVPGPGKYITVYANGGHAYMYIDGMLYDTAGRSGVYASRWLVGATDNSGYVARHWPGL